MESSRILPRGRRRSIRSSFPSRRPSGWVRCSTCRARWGSTTTGALVPGGIEAETRQALENIRSVLERHGSSMDRVIKCTAMLADMQEWAAMNRVYVEYFSTNLPARSAFGASGLALGGRVEIECLATIE